MKTFKFEGSGAEYFKIWIVNILLTVITLGFYYPWAKVRNKRYFYANTTLENRNFEYHATGKQLFLGFLISMTLLIMYVVIQKVFPLGSMALLVISFISIPWIILRSMKFSMRMTSFSNVHFSFVGKLSSAYMHFFIYPLLLIVGYIVFVIIAQFLAPILGTILTGVLTFIFFSIFSLYSISFIKKKNTEYIIDGSRYGQGVFNSNIEVKSLINIMLKTMGVSIVVISSIMIILGVFVAMTIGLEELISMQESLKQPAQIAGQLGKLLPVISVAYFAMILAFMFVLAYSLTRQRSYIYENMNIDNTITFKSTLEAKPLAWIMATNFIVIILTLGFAIPWAKVRLTRILLENTQIDAKEGFDAYINQKQEECSSLGEQLGDAFDVDVGL